MKLYYAVAQVLLISLMVDAFIANGRGGNNRNLPPGGPPRGPPSHRKAASSSPEPFDPSSTTTMSAPTTLQRTGDDLWETQNVKENHKELTLDSPRGGSQQHQIQPATDVVKGTKATLSATASFWGQTFGRLISGTKHRVARAGSGLMKRFKSPSKRKEEELLEQLQTMPVQRVVVKDSQVLPKEVVQIATRRSGMLGQPLQTDRVQELARTLKQWYDRQGYVLHSVTGATLEASTATAEIQVQEPVSSQQPVRIIFCKEMVIDTDTGDLLTVRQYKDRHAVKRNFGVARQTTQEALQAVNTTLIETNGRTKPSRIARALGLSPNRPFRWNPQRWQNIVHSGVFTRIVRATPQPLSDGTVQLNIVAQEAPTRHLEYGLGKSLYTGSWEGELDFEHANLLGGGERIGLSVRRGTKDVEPSVRLRFTDDKFGLEGGYDVEVFSDYIGNTPDGEESSSGLTDEAAEVTDDTAPGWPPEPSPSLVIPDYDQDALLSRQGATFRLRNPFNPEVIRNSMLSASLERTTTKTGLHEKVCSSTIQLGPFRRSLPMDALSSIDTSLTTGTRILDAEAYVDEATNKTDSDTSKKRSNSFDLKPYASFTATTKQIIPLLETRTAGKRPLILALKHSATLSSFNLPRHEANAQGIANNIRGARANDRVSSALRGTTEVRIPVDIPMLSSNQQDANVVLFGDWLFATKDSTSPISRKSSVGIGLRKSFQGLPLNCNFCYSGDGKIKTLVGLGGDFDA